MNVVTSPQLTKPHLFNLWNIFKSKRWVVGQPIKHLRYLPFNFFGLTES